MEMKFCKNCGESKLLSEFVLVKGKYLHSYCRLCNKSLQKEWRNNNKDKSSEYRTRWAAKNPTYQAEYRKNNPEKFKGQKKRKEYPHLNTKEYRAKYRDAERDRAYLKKWRESNKDKIAAYYQQRRDAGYFREWCKNFREKNGKYYKWTDKPSDYQKVYCQRSRDQLRDSYVAAKLRKILKCKGALPEELIEIHRTIIKIKRIVNGKTKDSNS